MKYDEQVKALRHCMTKEDGITICEPCPYYGKGIECENVLHTDAAAAIEELSKTVKDLTTKVECSPMQISEKAFDRAIEAWNERARKAVQDG